MPDEYDEAIEFTSPCEEILARPDDEFAAMLAAIEKGEADAAAEPGTKRGTKG